MNQNSSLNVFTQRSQLFTFVTPEQVKVQTGLQPNINNDSIIIPIITATDMYIKPLLGDTLFNNLKGHFITANREPANLPDGSTLPDNVNYKALYEAIYMSLCWWSYIEALIVIAVKVDEAGIMFNNTSFSENAEAAGYTQLTNRQKKIAESYTDQLRCYINDVVITKNLPVEQENTGTTFYSLYMPTDYSKPCSNC